MIDEKKLIKDLKEDMKAVKSDVFGKIPNDYWDEMFEELVNLINNQPKLDGWITQWIPCSDRLPKKNGEYRVTVQYYNVNDLSEKSGKPKLDIVEFCDGKWRTAKFRKVVAWLENPKPYEVKTNE